MDMVGAVLRVVVLDQEGWSLNAVSVSSVAFAVAPPGEVDVVFTSFVNLLSSFGSDVSRHVLQVLGEQVGHQLLLVRRHIFDGQADGGAGVWLRCTSTADVIRSVFGQPALLDLIRRALFQNLLELHSELWFHHSYRSFPDFGQ